MSKRRHNVTGGVYTIEIERRRSQQDTPYRQRFLYRAKTNADTVATALQVLSAQAPLTDESGQAAEPIRWECSCLQKKCGACAMRICGRPGLACDARLSDLPGRILLEPLRKFPVVADLLIDRSIMQRNLKRAAVWLENEAQYTEARTEDAFEASRCLQCGLCLEVCPNFDPEGDFTGMAAAIPAARVLTAQAGSGRRIQASGDRSVSLGESSAAAGYREHFFEGCGKSLACQSICPAGIATGELLSQSNAVAVWKRKFRK